MPQWNTPMFLGVASFTRYYGVGRPVCCSLESKRSFPFMLHAVAWPGKYHVQGNRAINPR
jgi:hypothetical protein